MTSGIDQVDSESALKALSSNPNAILIDVRTRAEWVFVGVPDLTETGREPVMIEWQSFPTMEVNPGFASAALDALQKSGADTVYFLCRSGGRSMRAALTTAEAAGAAGRTVSCVNIADGFEGDLDGEGRRGRIGGWKACGLPWRQS